MQYALESQDPRLQGIEVQGDQIFGAGDSIKTRSKSRQCKHSTRLLLCYGISHFVKYFPLGGHRC